MPPDVCRAERSPPGPLKIHDTPGSAFREHFVALALARRGEGAAPISDFRSTALRELHDPAAIVGAAATGADLPDTENGEAAPTAEGERWPFVSRPRDPLAVVLAMILKRRDLERHRLVGRHATAPPWRLASPAPGGVRIYRRLVRETISVVVDPRPRERAPRISSSAGT